MDAVIQLNASELATVLAALRYWQRNALSKHYKPQEWGIATNEDSLEPLNEEQIDELCERLNQ